MIKETKRIHMIKAPITSYYGEPFVIETETGYALGIDSHSSAEYVEVSREFYEAWAAEFGHLSTDKYGAPLRDGLKIWTDA